MNTCPICKSPMDPDDAVCKACGYRLQDVTEAFKAVSLDSADETGVVHSPSSTSTLTVLYGKQEGIAYRLEGDRALIGRSPKCEVFLNDMTVSREHAVLERVEGGWTIRDADSFNGVWVNNVNVDHVLLNDRDVVQIGRFVLRYAQ